MPKCSVETAAACCCCDDGESASLTNKQTSIDKQNRRGAKILASRRRVRMRSSNVCFEPIDTKLCVRRRMQRLFLFSCSA